MKARASLADPANVAVQIVATMTVAEWTKVHDALQASPQMLHNHAAREFTTILSDTVVAARAAYEGALAERG